MTPQRLKRSKSPVSVYALVDPRDGETRYIGQSMCPKQRIYAHKSPSGSAPRVREWCRELATVGMRPRLVVLASVVGTRAASAIERSEIERAALNGGRLLNTRFVAA